MVLNAAENKLFVFCDSKFFYLEWTLHFAASPNSTPAIGITPILNKYLQGRLLTYEVFKNELFNNLKSRSVFERLNNNI